MANDALFAAGRTLARSLLEYQGRRDAVILAITSPALLIAQGASDVLNVPFDIFLVRKVTVADHDGVIAGAVARGAYVPSAKVMRETGFSLIAFVDAAKTEEQDIAAVEESYRDGARPVTLTGKTVILVDDGTSSPEDLLTAMTAIRRHGITGILVVAPNSGR